MKTFNYHLAKDVKDASKLSSSSSVFLAGGMTTIPSLKLGLASYKDVIDIKKIKKLSGIKVSGKSVTIGATTKHSDVANSKEIKKAIPSLAALAEGIGDPQVRNKGTIGGALAHSDPQADYPGAVLALKGTFILKGPSGERTIDADDYFTGLWETALGENEIFTEIRIPLNNANANSCYLKFPQPASRYPYVGCAVAMEKSGGNCSEVRVGFSGIADFAFCDTGVEDSIRGQELKD